jgi:hypothetical protein
MKRREVSPADLNGLQYDLFLSAYNSSERVSAVFAAVRAKRHIWLLHPEYCYDKTERPSGESYIGGDGTEMEFWFDAFTSLGLDAEVSSSRIAIDITGMMRSHLMALPLVLAHFNAYEVDILYSDPFSYMSGATTKFTTAPVERVTQIPGLEGVHSSRLGASDALIIGAGYDADLIRHIADYKRSAKHFLMVGLPGLQTHMYQEARYRISDVHEFLHRLSDKSYIFAPASDPFVTAQILHERVSLLRAEDPQVNIYLSAVGPKPQVLGFAWYLFREGQNQSVSAVFPYSPTYARETSVGLSRTHIYTLEFHS